MRRPFAPLVAESRPSHLRRLVLGASAVALLAGLAFIPTSVAAGAPAGAASPTKPASVAKLATVDARPGARAHAEPPSLLHAGVGKPAREIFGYATAGSLGDPSWGYTSWNWSLLSTVAYFALNIGADGAIVANSDWTTWNSSLVTGMMATAHAHGAKVIVTIDLHDFAPGNSVMCTGLVNRATTVAQTVATVAARGADGVEVDYEGLNGTCPDGETSRAMMTDLVRLLRAGLGSASYLSVSTYASSASDSLGFFDVAGMSPFVDSFFVMAYDLEYSNYRQSPTYCASFCLGPTAPLSGYYYNDTSIASQYTAVVPASQVILGVPYYGRKSCVVSAALNPYPSSAVTADSYLDWAAEITDPSVRPGSYVSRVDTRDPAGRETWNTWFNQSLGCERELYMDDAGSLGRKYDLVNSDGLRGVGIWTLNYGGGAPELWAALSSHFAICSSLQASTTAASPQPTGSAIHVVAAASPCTHPLYEFWLQPPGGGWTLVQPYTSSPNLYLQTLGKPAGSYRFSVWARDLAGYGDGMQYSFQAFSAFDYSLTPTCSAVTSPTAQSPAGSLGVTETILAAASGCPTPLYEFWVQPPGGAWTLAQTYTSSAHLSWATAGKAAGSYRFSIWARDASSPNAYDAFTAFQYVLTPTCTSVTSSTVPLSATTVGNNVTLSAAATGCSSPQYEFWVHEPGEAWTLAQTYSSNSSFKLITAGKAWGAYRFSIWARDSTSSNTYDAFRAFDYTLLPICGAVGATTLPSTAAGVGNTVTVTASASGCPNPLYEFWVLAPGGTWTLAQPYSASSVFKWVTAGKAKGVYRISVWVRDASSPGYSGAPPFVYDGFSAFVYSLV